MITLTKVWRKLLSLGHNDLAREVLAMHHVSEDLVDVIRNLLAKADITPRDVTMNEFVIDVYILSDDYVSTREVLRKAGLQVDPAPRSNEAGVQIVRVIGVV